MELVTINNGQNTVCEVQAFRAKFDDAYLVKYLHVCIIADNLLSVCTLHWALFDEFEQQVRHGTVEISGDTYITWNGDNNYPFTYVAGLYSLTIL